MADDKVVPVVGEVRFAEGGVQSMSLRRAVKIPKRHRPQAEGVMAPPDSAEVIELIRKGEIKLHEDRLNDTVSDIKVAISNVINLPSLGLGKGQWSDAAWGRLRQLLGQGRRKRKAMAEVDRFAVHPTARLALPAPPTPMPAQMLPLPAPQHVEAAPPSPVPDADAGEATPPSPALDADAGEATPPSPAPDADAGENESDSSSSSSTSSDSSDSPSGKVAELQSRINELLKEKAELTEKVAQVAELQLDKADLFDQMAATQFWAEEMAEENDELKAEVTRLKARIATLLENDASSEEMGEDSEG